MNDEHEVVDYEWGSILSMTVAFPVTGFRFPGLISAVVLSAVAMFIQDDPNFSLKDGSVTITTRDGSAVLPLGSHHLGGYWKGSVTAVQRFIDRLVVDSSTRVLLGHPDTLIRSVAGTARRRVA